YFDYCIKNGVKYRMWIDLRIGLENYMELIYHKVGILNQRFLSQRKVVNILYNPDNINEFMIDLGVATDSLPRYIYVIKQGSNAFRGNITSTPKWGLSTKFAFVKTSMPSKDNTIISPDYNDIDTEGVMEGFKESSAGLNPHSYQEAFDEAAKMIGGTNGLIKYSALSLTTYPAPSTLIISNTKDFLIKTDSTGILDIKYILLSEYNGRKESQLFGRYFGERSAVSTARLRKLPIGNNRHKIKYKGQIHKDQWLVEKGYEWYSLTPEIFRVTNAHVGGDNIWRTVLPNTISPQPNYFHTDFLVKKINNNNYVVLDLFNARAMILFEKTLEITANDFDIDNPSDAYIFKRFQ
ncbi:MAG: hypothetical protein ACRCTJ_00095, partial [Brevinema sp.]